jgi:hypothetical protein
MSGLKPLHQGSLDGLCGVYAVINAVRFLVPAARNDDFLNKLMIHIVGKIYTAKDVTAGGTEIKLASVFEYARSEVSRLLKVGLSMSNKGRIGSFESPADAMASTFAAGRPGVFIVGYEGRDSHWTVVPQITKTKALLFDSCGLTEFSRRSIVWSRDAKPPSKLVIVSPGDLNWITV